MRLQEQNMCINEENRTTVDELLDPVSYEDQKQMYKFQHTRHPMRWF